MAYVIDVKNGVNRGTVVADVGFRYNLNLNEINEAEIKISGTGTTKRSLMVIGATVFIYKDGTLVFEGIIDNTDYFLAGTISFHVSGYEVWLAKENGDYTSSPWTSTASATIFSSIIGESSYLTAGTINAGFVTDFRLSTSNSLWNAIGNLAKKTTQDISIDYTTKQVSILDHIGSSTSVAVLNSGKEIFNMQRSVGLPRGNVIEVFGKGDGNEQIKGSAEDATSIAIYGRIKKPVFDRSCMTTAEANKLADAELSLNKDPPNIYDFDLTNPEYSGISLGDLITINALDYDVVNTVVRIVGIEEGDIGGVAYKKLQVTNPELKTLMKTRNKYLAKIIKDQHDDNSYMQGSGNLSQWGNQGNANNAVPNYVYFNIDAAHFQDEAGVLRIASMTLDYDVDKYKRNFDNVAEYAGGDMDVNGVSGTTAPDVENDSASNYANSIVAEDDATFSSSSLAGGSWHTVATFNNIAANGDGIFFYGNYNIVGHDDPTTRISYYARIYNNDTGLYYPSSAGVRIGRGKYRFDTASGDMDISTDGDHRHEPSDGRYFMTENSAGTGGIDYRGYTDYDGNHDHDGSYYVVQWNLNFTIPCPVNPYLDDWEVQFKGVFGSGDDVLLDGYCAYDVQSRHEHGAGGYNAELHPHDEGSYEVDNTEVGNIDIGDGVGEAAGVNATSIQMILEFWNTGTLDWDTKYTIASTGQTLERDLDITNGGAYPDATGYWRVKTLTNSATSDFVQGIVKVKHEVDN